MLVNWDAMRGMATAPGAAVIVVTTQSAMSQAWR